MTLGGQVGRFRDASAFSCRLGAAALLGVVAAAGCGSGSVETATGRPSLTTVSAHEGIRVDDGTLVGPNEVVVVVGADSASASAALRAAGERFMLVDERGVEYTHEEFDELEDETEYYTPNYVSDVTMTERGPSMYVDCKGEIPPAMGAALVTILIEELKRHGVTDAELEGHPL